MNTIMKNAALAISLLLAVTTAQALNPIPQRPDSLLGAVATVVSVNSVKHSVVLRVRSVSRDSLPFVVSPSCLFVNGLASFDDLFPNERVLVWTQGGQTGTLPVIYRVDRAQN